MPPERRRPSEQPPAPARERQQRAYIRRSPAATMSMPRGLFSITTFADFTISSANFIFRPWHLLGLRRFLRAGNYLIDMPMESFLVIAALPRCRSATPRFLRFPDFFDAIFRPPRYAVTFSWAFSAVAAMAGVTAELQISRVPTERLFQLPFAFAAPHESRFHATRRSRRVGVGMPSCLALPFISCYKTMPGRHFWRFSAADF